MMAGTIVAFDVVWFSILAIAVSRARQAFVEGPWQARFERLTGTVLVGLGVRLATARH
jgi:threonine/homoserine/homoserine lactone efflux protein